MKSVPFDPALLNRMYTKTEYAKDFGITRRTLDKRISRGEVETIPIRGTTIVLAPAAQ